MQNVERSPLVSRAFKPSAWLANIDFMKHLILEKHLLLVVMSEAGGGKSTFVDLMRLRLETVIQSVALEIDPQSPVKSMLNTLSPLLNVPLPEVSLVAGVSLSQFFEQLPPQSQPLLFVIENAQLLPESFLAQLIHLYQQWGQAKHFTICLVSDFRLTPVLKRLERVHQSALIHTIEPGPLTEEETKTYVLKYCQGRAAFTRWCTTAQLKAFYHLTAGQMLRINQQLAHLEETLRVPTTFERFGDVIRHPGVLWSSAFLLIGSLLYAWLLLNPLSSGHSLWPGSTLAQHSASQATTQVSQIAPWYADVQIAEGDASLPPSVQTAALGMGDMVLPAVPWFSTQAVDSHLAQIPRFPRVESHNEQG